MTPKKFIVFLLINSCCFCYSQKQTDWWYFGTYAGMTFTSGTAVAVSDGTLTTSEGSSAMSDATGNLLFYTDGKEVYTSTHTIMANGTGLLGDISTTQSALIIAKPGDPNLYYIFTLPEEGNGNFCYSVVDMSLAGGQGSVTVKNTILKNGNVTEKLTAVRHCNGNDIWVMIHEFNSNAFYAYLVTNAGINPAVISNVGQPHNDVHGQMKFNNNGSKIACMRDSVIFAGNPYNGKGYLDLFNFDNTTGIVYNPKAITLNNYQKCYGLEFSQDNSKLYGGFYDQSGFNGGNSYLLQFDLTVPNIVSSAFVVSTFISGPIHRSLQIARDGKIYVCKSNTPFVCVVNSPNVAGAGCNYTDDAINIDPLSMGNMNLLGLPNFLTSYFNATFPAVTPCIMQVKADFINSDTTICKGDCINFTDLSTGSVSAWSWTFPGATPSVSSVQNPSPVCFPTAGTYTVRLIASNGSMNDSVKKIIIVNPCTVAVVADFVNSDTTICSGSCISFTDLSTGSVTAWSWTFPGAMPSVSSIKNPGPVCFGAAGTFTVKLIATNGGVTDSIKKTITVMSTTLSVGADATIALGSSITLNANSNATTYTWTPATGLSSVNVLNPVANPTVTTTYTVSGTGINNCTVSRTITVNVFTVEIPCGDLFIPTAFSPNGDGENDLECVLGNCIETMQLYIYDRWGEKVFESDDPKKCWDGIWQGKAMDTGVFVYHLIATFKSGESVEKKGNIHLIR